MSFSSHSYSLVNISWQRFGIPPSSSALILGIQLNGYDSLAYFVMTLKCTIYQNHYLWDRLHTKETMGEKEADYFPITQTKSLKKWLTLYSLSIKSLGSISVRILLLQLSMFSLKIYLDNCIVLKSDIVIHRMAIP